MSERKKGRICWIWNHHEMGRVAESRWPVIVAPAVLQYVTHTHHRLTAHYFLHEEWCGSSSSSWSILQLTVTKGNWMRKMFQPMLMLNHDSVDSAAAGSTSWSTSSSSADSVPHVRMMMMISHKRKEEVETWSWGPLNQTWTNGGEEETNTKRRGTSFPDAVITAPTFASWWWWCAK